jgi:cytochrome c
MRRSIAAWAFASILLAGGAAQAAGDPERGKVVFDQCKLCHSLEPDMSRVGPTLHGLFGRKAGSVTGYDYSAGMKHKNIVWTEQTLRQYLSDPKGFVPGSKKAIQPIKDPKKLDDLIAYLKQATQ